MPAADGRLPGLKVARTSPAEPEGGLPQRVLRAELVTQFGVLRLRTPRTRQLSFLPQRIAPPQRRQSKVADLIRQAFCAKFQPAK